MQPLVVFYIYIHIKLLLTMLLFISSYLDFIEICFIFSDYILLCVPQRIDMVPELLSSNLCSLRSNVDR